MKYLNIVLLLIPFLTFSQEDVPSEYWIDDNNFEDKIKEHKAFGDDQSLPIVVEFWAEWNKHNECKFLKDLEQCNIVKADIVASKALADNYDVDVLPTLVIFHNNEEVTRFKGDLLFRLNVKKKEVQEKVDSIIISKFQ
jgi:thioredoxin-like negative regulator of GroEL